MYQDLSFLATRTKALALLYHITNYATEDEALPLNKESAEILRPQWSQRRLLPKLPCRSSRPNLDGGMSDNKGFYLLDGTTKANSSDKGMINFSLHIFNRRCLF